MTQSTFPRFADLTVDFRDARLAGPPGEPITPWTADVFNWLAAVLMQTQRGLGIKFGDHRDLGTGFGVPGFAETFGENMQERIRFELGTATGTSGTTKAVLFSHTTNGGAAANQRFDNPSTNSLRVFLTMTAGTISNPGVYHVSSIQRDGSLYPYGFTITCEHGFTGAETFEWFALQNWG